MQGNIGKSTSVTINPNISQSESSTRFRVCIGGEIVYLNISHLKFVSITPLVKMWPSIMAESNWLAFSKMSREGVAGVFYFSTIDFLAKKNNSSLRRVLEALWWARGSTSPSRHISTISDTWTVVTERMKDALATQKVWSCCTPPAIRREYILCKCTGGGGGIDSVDNFKLYQPVSGKDQLEKMNFFYPVFIIQLWKVY